MWYVFPALPKRSRRVPFRPWLLPEGCAKVWPDPSEAEPDEGLVAVGGDLSAERLMSAYGHGIFPWYSEGTPILWWCPEPRAILESSKLHVSRSLRRTLRKSAFEIRIDSDFEGVIDGCAMRDEGTWILPEMRAAYLNLHVLGLAHSFEVWQNAELVGGLYGVQVGALFAAESMFHRATDASKVTLAACVTVLFDAGFELFDVQFMTPHLASLGASPIPRREYLSRVQAARSKGVHWSHVVARLAQLDSTRMGQR